MLDMKYLDLLDLNVYIGQNYVRRYININAKVLNFSYLMEYLIL